MIQITEDTVMKHLLRVLRKNNKPTRLEGTFEHRKQTQISLRLYLPDIFTLKLMD